MLLPLLEVYRVDTYLLAESLHQDNVRVNVLQLSLTLVCKREVASLVLAGLTWWCHLVEVFESKEVVVGERIYCEMRRGGGEKFRRKSIVVGEQVRGLATVGGQPSDATEGRQKSNTSIRPTGRRNNRHISLSTLATSSRVS